LAGCPARGFLISLPHVARSRLQVAGCRLQVFRCSEGRQTHGSCKINLICAAYEIHEYIWGQRKPKPESPSLMWLHHLWPKTSASFGLMELNKKRAPHFIPWIFWSLGFCLFLENVGFFLIMFYWLIKNSAKKISLKYSWK